MAEVKVLIEGYAKETGSGWLASCTTTLIEDSGKKVLVDPGVNKGLLLEKLKKEGLNPNDIDVVFLTHYHLDHLFLCAVFENAKFLDGGTIYEQDLETEYTGFIPGTAIKPIPTPGHADEHYSVVVETGEGTVVVAADVFWWTEAEEQRVDDYDILLNRQDPFVKDFTALKESRKKVLEMADWVIPGHGKKFKNLFRK